MKRYTRSSIGLLTTSLVTMLIVLVTSCTKDEVFNTGTVKTFILQSTSYDAAYEIKVGLPANYNPSGEKYATVYVLDGKEIFGIVANRCQEISNQYGLQNVIVVGIGYGRNRSIDYTPTKMSSVTGGGPQFLAFLETQLIPQIEHEFHADTSRSGRIILGHSYGGLFGSYAFAVRNKVFGNYILLSPSLWFNNYSLLQMEKENRPYNRLQKMLVFMGIGENEETDRMLAPFHNFFQSLQDHYFSIKLSKHIENNTGHMDSRNPDIFKGLHYYFMNR